MPKTYTQKKITDYNSEPKKREEPNEDLNTFMAFLGHINNSNISPQSNSEDIDLYNISTSTSNNIQPNKTNYLVFKELINKVESLIQNYVYIGYFSSALKDLQDITNRTIKDSVRFNKKDKAAIVLCKNVKEDNSIEEIWDNLLDQSENNYSYELIDNSCAVKILLLSMLVFSQQKVLLNSINKIDEKDKYLNYLSSLQESMADKFFDASKINGINKEICILASNYFYNQSLISLCETKSYKNSKNKDDVSNGNSKKFVLQFSKLHCITELSSLDDLSEEEVKNYEEQAINYAESKLSCCYNGENFVVNENFFKENSSYILDFSYYFKYKLKYCNDDLETILNKGKYNLDLELNSKFRSVENSMDNHIKNIVSLMKLASKYKIKANQQELYSLIKEYLSLKKGIHLQIEENINKSLNSVFSNEQNGSVNKVSRKLPDKNTVKPPKKKLKK